MSYTTQLRARCFALTALFCLPLPVPATQAQAAAPAVDRGAIVAGAKVERELGPASADVFAFVADREQFVSIVVEQRGIDVVVRLFDPSGTQLHEFDSPNGLNGPEPATFLASEPGVHRVEVRSLDPKATPGRYEIRIDEARPGTQADRSRVAALRAYTAGNLLRGQRTAPARRQMIAHYVKAADFSHEAGDFRNEAIACNEAGLGARSISDYGQAFTLLERAAKAAHAANDRVTQGTALNNLGFTYDSYGDKPKAIEYYEASADVYRALGNGPEEARALANLGKTYSDMGEARKALELLTVANQRLREINDEEWTAGTLNNLASVYTTLREYPTAIANLEEAITIYRKINKPRGLGSALGNLGLIHETLGEPARAMELYKEALDIWIKANNPYGTALSLNRIASLLDKRGEQDKALELLERALGLNKSNVLGSAEGVTHLQLGAIRHARGETRRAAEHYETALGKARAISQPALEMSALSGLARLDRDTGQLARAEARIREAIAVAEAVRLKSGGQEARAAVLSSAQPLYETLVDVLMLRRKAESNDAFAAEALRASEQARARSLVELLAETGIDVKQGVDAELLGRERNLRQRLVSKAEYQTQLLSAQSSGDLAKSIAAEIALIRTEYDQVQQHIRDRNPRYAALTQPRALTLEDIRKDVLDADSLLLEYALGETRSYLWAVSATGVTAYDLPPRAEIEEAARRVYNLLVEPGRRVKFETSEERAGRIARSRTDFANEAAALSQMILGPAATQLGRKRLIIVPDGALQYVPFAALPEPGRPAGAENPPLIVNHEIASVPSATALAVLRRETEGRKPGAKTLAVLADPVFSRDDPRLKSTPKEAGPPRITPAATRAFDTVTGELPRLAFSRKEAQSIARFVPKAQRFEAFDFDASRAALIRPDLKEYRILHIATHGFLNASDPALSGLMLSRVEPDGQPRDGLVLSQEIYNLDLAADLVVLSACRTGLGKDIRGEGLVGLTRGFLYAGARRVIVSLWSVDDAATAVLMEQLYDQMLVKKASPPAALRSAQLTLCRGKTLSHPYYWAAFVVQGEWKGSSR